MHIRFVFLALVFVLGLSLLSGISGNVISETCCEGKSCNFESKCVLQQPANMNDWVGVPIVLISILIALGEVYLYRRQKPKEKIDRVI